MSLADLVRPGLITLSASGKTDEDVIRLLAESLVAGGFARESLADAAVERERQHPTGLVLDARGGNAAIPHADVGHVIAPAIALGVLSDPVDFRRMDQVDEAIQVRLVLLLALPDAESQLSALRDIGALLQDPLRIEAILAATSVDAVVSALGGPP